MGTSNQYISLARKYRPKLFADLVGQEVLTKVLDYSIQQNQLVTSFLFTGIRGIGKTTSARILAQTINCTSHKLVDKLVTPCGLCENCKAFQSQSHPDIIEIDAASYTSVDNIRDVVEKSIYMPVLGKYKIFIIDEVHMLSKSAFNALLKTLEEPPSHVIFILLTTEVTKVPITILSRCQKFNLKRFSINDLVFLLEKICKNEGIACDQIALESIAYKSDGSARDATVLLEQSWFLAKQKGSHLSFEIVRESLDLNNTKSAIDFVAFIISQDAKGAINLIAELYRENFDFLNVIQSIIELLALLSKLKLIPGYNLGHYQAYETEIKDLLGLCDLGFLTSLWQIFNKGLQEVSLSSNKLISFEMLIIKAIYCSLMPLPEELGSISSNSDKEAQPRPQVKKIPEVIAVKSAQDVKSSKIHSIEKEVAPEIRHVASTGPIDQNALFDFIRYIHKNHMFELYHFIMNECEIVNFNHGVLTLGVEKFQDEIKLLLASALKDWSKIEWQIKSNTSIKIESLQFKLKTQAKEDKNFKLVASFFPETAILDVWFNFLAK